MAKRINALPFISIGIGLLASGSRCLAEAAGEGPQSGDRIVWLSALAVVLTPLFLWHRWRFVSAKPSLPVPMPESLALSRNTVVSQFMKWLKSRAVQELILQREDLISTQQLAEMEIARLEQMLIDLHAPVQQRLRQYEQRIAELEQALSLKGEQSGELIEAMIRLTRQKLEAERALAAGSGEG